MVHDWSPEIAAVRSCAGGTEGNFVDSPAHVVRPTPTRYYRVATARIRFNHGSWQLDT